MHQYIVNASLQILPIVQNRHPYEWVDEAIAVIEQSGIQYEVGPFATVVEGTYEEVIQVVNDINNYLQQHGCTEWILNAQIQLRAAGDITADEKTCQIQIASCNPGCTCDHFILLLPFRKIIFLYAYLLSYSRFPPQLFNTRSVIKSENIYPHI